MWILSGNIYPLNIGIVKSGRVVFALVENYHEACRRRSHYQSQTRLMIKYNGKSVLNTGHPASNVLVLTAASAEDLGWVPRSHSLYICDGDEVRRG